MGVASNGTEEINEINPLKWNRYESFKWKGLIFFEQDPPPPLPPPPPWHLILNSPE